MMTMRYNGKSSQVYISLGAKVKAKYVTKLYKLLLEVGDPAPAVCESGVCASEWGRFDGGDLVTGRVRKFRLRRN